MSVNYTILKSSIIYSTIWEEDAETCKVWVTMLAMRNKDGEIFSSLPGLAHTARIGIEKTVESVQKFLSPDKNSSTKEFDGRRIEEIDGGWRLLNHEKVKAEAQAANKAIYMRDYMKKKRANKNGETVMRTRHGLSPGEPSAERIDGNGEVIHDKPAA